MDGDACVPPASGQGKAIVGLKPRGARSHHEGVPQGRRTGIVNAEAGRHSSEAGALA